MARTQNTVKQLEELPDPAIQAAYDSLNPKHQAFAMLKDIVGLNNTDASKALGFSRANGTLVSKKLNKLMITGNTKKLRLADKALNALLAGQAVGTVEKVKDSTVLQAAQMVYDRVDPIKRDLDAPTSVSFTQINVYASNGADIQTNDATTTYVDNTVDKVIDV